MRMLKSVIPQSAKAKIKLLLNSEVLSFWALAALLLPSLFGTQKAELIFLGNHVEMEPWVWFRADYFAQTI